MTYYERRDTIQIVRQTYDGETHQLIGIRPIGKPTVVINMSGGYVDGYTDLGGGSYMRNTTIVNGVDMNKILSR